MSFKLIPPSSATTMTMTTTAAAQKPTSKTDLQTIIIGKSSRVDGNPNHCRRINQAARVDDSIIITIT